MGYKINYTEEMHKFLADNQFGISRKELTDRFNLKFNTNLKKTTISAYCQRHNMKNGIDCRFHKGNVPYNKSIPMSKERYEKCQATMFKKGQQTANHREVGSERITKDGYIEIKVAEPNKWMLKHRYVWEKVNGPIPKGKVLIFADQNKQNVDISNLILLSRSHLAELNRQGSSLTNDRDINDVIINIANLSVRINQIKKKRKEIDNGQNETESSQPSK